MHLFTLVLEALFEAKETRGEKEKSLVTSVVNPTSTLDQVQNLNLACDWPFVKICQTGLGKQHYCKLIIAIKAIISLFITQTGLTYFYKWPITFEIQILNLIKCGIGICDRCDQKLFLLASSYFRVTKSLWNQGSTYFKVWLELLSRDSSNEYVRVTEAQVKNIRK